MAKPRTAGHQQTFLKYSFPWSTTADPLQIEFECIRRFGKWTFRDRQCGNGLAFHVKQAMKMLWPEMKWHRWVDLMVDEFCRGGRLAIIGPASSWKSYVFSRAAQAIFYAFPGDPNVEQSGCTVIISSTTLAGLHKRIWDYVVSGHKMAKARFPWLSGSLIESRTMLLSDEKDTEGRSYKNGIIGVAAKKGGEFQGISEYIGIKNKVFIMLADECFTADTLVDTLKGPRPIHSIRPGDAVYNASGIGIVQAVKKSVPSSLLRVTTKDKRIFEVTPNHPFLTQFGWVKACELLPKHYMLGTHEAMRIVREIIPTDKENRTFLRQLLLSEMVASPTRSSIDQKEEKAPSSMQILWKAGHRHMESVLQPELQQSVAPRRPGLVKAPERIHERGLEKTPCRTPGVESQIVSFNEGQKSNGSSRIGSQSQCDIKSDWAQTKDSLWEWNRSYSSRKSASFALSGSNKQLCHSNNAKAGQWFSGTLQGGLGIPEHQAGSGVRRFISRSNQTEGTGCKENESLNGAWVDSVEVLEQTSFKTAGSRSERDFVYNLQVSRHPSYSVNGVLVHNCSLMPMGFLDALANLESNGIVFTALMGNLPDVHNPLGRAAEPKLGWDALPDTEKSRVWDTRWHNGRCLQLIGTDSPNFDYPAGQEPFDRLIGRRYIEQCAENYGRESDKFNMFASGKIPRSSMDRTVFTKAQCYKYNAMEKVVVWGHDKLVRGYALDAAYSGIGGDRTVGAPFIFGKDAVGAWRFWLGDMKIYAGSTNREMSHAEAIALEVRADCQAHGVVPEHFFFDGTGRSELTHALAKHWSTAVVPIEFGGPATERPAFTGERHFGTDSEKDGATKTCREVFDRFVTELWFALRECILSDQMRGLTEDFITENCQRKWELVKGAKYKIEPKDGTQDGERTGMKARGLRSPDTGDMAVCALEGARRLGFPLGKLAKTKSSAQNGWFAALNEQTWTTIKKESLLAA